MEKEKRRDQNHHQKRKNNEVVYSEGKKVKEYRVDCWNN